MATFLRGKNILATDVAPMQKSWKNEEQHTTHQPGTATFQLLYPLQTPEGTGPRPGPGVRNKIRIIVNHCVEL